MSPQDRIEKALQNIESPKFLRTRAPKGTAYITVGVPRDENLQNVIAALRESLNQPASMSKRGNDRMLTRIADILEGK